MNSTRLTILGLLFLASVSVLAFYTLFLTDFDPFGKATLMTVEFPEARGLREGDAVLVAGIRVGRVGTLEFLPERPRAERIRVTLRLEREVPLRQDYEVSIEDATLLGGRNVTIEPGSVDLPVVTVAPGEPLRGSLADNPLEALSSVGEVIEENREAIGNAIDNIEEVTRLAREGEGVLGRLLADEGLGENAANFLRDMEQVAADLSSATAEMTEGRGALGRLFYDEGLGESLSGAVLNLEEITAGLEAGEGTLGRLLKDEEMSQNVSDTVASAREIADKINRGEGTLGALVNDSSISDDLGKVLHGLAEGEGSMGLLLTSDELYVDAKVLFENLSAVSAHVRSGQGTLGKLVMNEELYDEALTAVSLLTRSLEDFREAAPTSTFTSVLFGAF